MLTNTKQQYECEFPPHCKKQSPLRTGPVHRILLDAFNRNHSLLHSHSFMDLLSATVSQKQRRFIDQLSLTKAVEMPSADMKTWILPRGFFLCHPKRMLSWKAKIKQNKTKREKKKSLSIYLCMQSDVTATHCITSRGLGRASCSTLGFIFLLGSSLDNPPVRIQLLPKAARDEMSRCWKEGIWLRTHRTWTHMYLCVCRVMWTRTFKALQYQQHRTSHSVAYSAQNSINMDFGHKKAN